MNSGVHELSAPPYLPTFEALPRLFEGLRLADERAVAETPAFLTFIDVHSFFFLVSHSRRSRPSLAFSTYTLRTHLRVVSRTNQEERALVVGRKTRQASE